VCVACAAIALNPDVTRSWAGLHERSCPRGTLGRDRSDGEQRKAPGGSVTIPPGPGAEKRRLLVDGVIAGGPSAG
jgi:hypothetical protein